MASVPLFYRQPARLSLLLWALVWSSMSLAQSAELGELTRMDELRAGSLMFTTGQPGWYKPAPTLRTEVDIHITGPIARTRLVQVFHNAGGEWAEAIYAFPLPEDAAVDRLKMHVGERVIVGEIQEKAQARATYAQAAASGRRAALVEQSRPNLFSTKVANIAPDASIRIELEYQQQLAWRDGEFSLRFPMAITPRYKPGTTGSEERPETLETLKQQIGLSRGWAILPGELPNAVEWPPRESLGLEVAESINPTRLNLLLDAGFELASVHSDTHPILSRRQAEHWHVEFAAGVVRADRDFVLRWRPLPQAQPQAAFFNESRSSGDYGLLMLMPPQAAIMEAQTQSRELIFVIDTSGSMGGQSMRAAKAALLRGLGSLEPGDSFNLIEFDDQATALFSRPQVASEHNLRRARGAVSRLRAGGGTEMAKALRLALGQAEREEVSVLRQLVFITDGAVGNEQQLFSMIHAGLGSARLFTVGIGSAPNSHFMTEAAHFGRGSFRYIASPAEVEEGMTALFAQLRHPALTDIELDLPVSADVLPSPIPDLYLGEPLILAMKLDGAATEATVRGRIGNRPWQVQLALGQPAEQAGLGVLWARQKIKHWVRSAQRGLSEDQRREKILELALAHHLVSDYTSLVAVDKTPARPVEESLERHALRGELPAGFAANTSVQLAQGGTASLMLMVLGALMLMLGLGLLRVAPRLAVTSQG